MNKIEELFGTINIDRYLCTNDGIVGLEIAIYFEGIDDFEIFTIFKTGQGNCTLNPTTYEKIKENYLTLDEFMKDLYEYATLNLL